MLTHLPRHVAILALKRVVFLSLLKHFSLVFFEFFVDKTLLRKSLHFLLLNASLSRSKSLLTRLLPLKLTHVAIIHRCYRIRISLPFLRCSHRFAPRLLRKFGAKLILIWISKRIVAVRERIILVTGVIVICERRRLELPVALWLLLSSFTLRWVFAAACSHF
jgi:hypothetical protein